MFAFYYFSAHKGIYLNDMYIAANCKSFSFPFISAYLFFKLSSSSLLKWRPTKFVHLLRISAFMRFFSLCFLFPNCWMNEKKEFPLLYYWRFRWKNILDTFIYLGFFMCMMCFLFLKILFSVNHKCHWSNI